MRSSTRRTAIQERKSRTATGRALRLALCLASLASVAAVLAIPLAAQQGPNLRLEADKTLYESRYGSGNGRGARAVLTVSPPKPTTAGRFGDILVVCRNERLDPAGLRGRGQGCSGEARGGFFFQEADASGRMTGTLNLAGHYEAGIKRWWQTPNTYEWSNIVSFDVIDECHLTVEVLSLTPPFQARRGAPIPCSSGEHHGRAVLRGSDGSRLSLSSSGALSWHYETSYFGIPALQLYAQAPRAPSRADVAYRVGSKLGRLVLLASTQTGVRLGDMASVASVGVADVSLVHRSGVTTVRVRRGAAVGFRLPLDQMIAYITRRCRARPTLGCLTGIRYRVGPRLDRLEAAKLIRAGQSAVFRRTG